nr:group II intron maturase-specific domain-containing protein [Caballeronia sp. dw_19]
MRQKVRGWRIHRRTPATLNDLAQQCNLTMQGWWNYYGAFYQTAMHELFQYVDGRLEQWARRKYKTLSGHRRRSVEWLRKMKRSVPRMFVHWRVVEGLVG